MRPRFRLRTALIVIALLSPPLAGLTAVVRRGGPAGFIRYHDARAFDYLDFADRSRSGINNYRMHAALGHSCAVCRWYDRPVAVLIREQSKQMRAYERAARWHEFLAGPKWLRRWADASRDARL